MVEYDCPKCKKNCFFSKTLRFRTIPRVLIITVHRFSFANWVPKKVDIDLTGLSPHQPFNLEAFVGKGV